MAFPVYWWQLESPDAQKILRFCEIDENSSVEDIETKLVEAKHMVKFLEGITEDHLKANRQLREELRSREYVQQNSTEAEFDAKKIEYLHFCSRKLKERRLNVDQMLKCTQGSIDVMNLLVSLRRTEGETEKAAPDGSTRDETPGGRGDDGSPTPMTHLARWARLRSSFSGLRPLLPSEAGGPCEAGSSEAGGPSGAK